MKNSGMKRFLLRVALPLAVVLLIALYNVFLGLAALVILIVYALIRGRSKVFAYIGNMSYSKGNIDNALKWFEKSCRTGKASNRHKVSFAYLLLKTGRIDQSEEVLNKVLSTRPEKDDEMYAKSNLALALWKKGNLDDAIGMLEEIIGDYKTSTIYGSLGYFLILKGDLERALTFNLEAYDYNNANTVILDNLGQNYYLLGRYEEADEIYGKLMAKNPTFPEAFYNYGLLLKKMEQPDKALEMFQKSRNYKTSFTSTITYDDIEREIGLLEAETSTGE